MQWTTDCIGAASISNDLPWVIVLLQNSVSFEHQQLGLSNPGATERQLLVVQDVQARVRRHQRRRLRRVVVVVDAQRPDVLLRESQAGDTASADHRRGDEELLGRQQRQQRQPHDGDVIAQQSQW